MLWRLIFKIISQRHHWWGRSLLPGILAFERHPMVNERKVSCLCLSQPCASDKRRIELLSEQFKTKNLAKLVTHTHLHYSHFSSGVFRLTPWGKGRWRGRSPSTEVRVRVENTSLSYWYYFITIFWQVHKPGEAKLGSICKTDLMFLCIWKGSTKIIFKQWITRSLMPSVVCSEMYSLVLYPFTSLASCKEWPHWPWTAVSVHSWD